MKLRRFFIARAIGLAFVLLVVLIVGGIMHFTEDTPSVVEQSASQAQDSSCTVDADCGIYAQCQQFSSSDSTLYAPCSYFATTQPRCINNECVYNAPDAIVDRCLPSCMSESIVPRECYTPRDSTGDQNADAECISHPEVPLACQGQTSCKNVYSGNCQGITATCVAS